MSKKLELGESEKTPLLLLAVEVEEVPTEGFKGRVWKIRAMIRTPDLEKHVITHTATTATEVGKALTELGIGLEFTILERKRGYDET